MEQLLLARRAARLTSNIVAASHNGGAIAFDSGHAFPGVLPDLTEFAASALSDHRPETLQYAPRPGLPELRTWIAEYMTGDGVANFTADNVQVVNGAKHGLELVCRLLLDEGDSIVVTAPTYFTAIPIFKSFGVEFIEIAQDNDGLMVDELSRALEEGKRNGRRLPKFIYDVPDFHNPTGVTMSRARREALIELAAAFGIYIVEDSPYRKVRFEGESQPSLKALDRRNTVLTLGTFSKLLAPGLRIGWIAGPARNSSANCAVKVRRRVVSLDATADHRILPRGPAPGSHTPRAGSLSLAPRPYGGRRPARATRGAHGSAPRRLLSLADASRWHGWRRISQTRGARRRDHPARKQILRGKRGALRRTTVPEKSNPCGL